MLLLLTVTGLTQHTGTDSNIAELIRHANVPIIIETYLTFVPPRSRSRMQSLYAQSNLSNITTDVQFSFTCSPLARF